MEVAEAACYLGGAISALMAKRIFGMHEKTFINKIFFWYFTVDAMMGTLNTYLLFRLQFSERYLYSCCIDVIMTRNDSRESHEERCSLYSSIWLLWEPQRQLILTGMMVLRCR